jgi:imidazolonepropionase-like amidohydrolase
VPSFVAAARFVYKVRAMPQTTAIVGAGALLGETLDFAPDATVVVVDDTITEVGRAGEVDIPTGSEIADATGLTLIPGFIDAHVHIGFYNPSDVLRGGVTTARDLAWPPERIHVLARSSASVDFDGPTVIAAGPMLTAPGGYPSRAEWAPRGTARVVASPEHAKQAVVQTADEGACVIKVALNPPVGPTLDLVTLRAIVDAAHERGLKVTAHVHGMEELTKALDAEIDELAHMLMGTERIPERTIERMVAQGMVVVPTLSIRFGTDRRVAIDNLGRFVAAGGSIVYGTDLGNAGPRPGIDPREVRALGKAGLSGKEIVASATVASARWLGLPSIGAIAPGRGADLVALAGNPLDDHKALTRVRIVWRKGRRAR